MFVFEFQDNAITLSSSQIIKRAPLSIGGFQNIDCANIAIGKKVVRAVSWTSFLTIIGISSRPKDALRSMERFLAHPSVRNSAAEKLLNLLSNSFIFPDGMMQVRFIDSQVLTGYCRLLLDLRRINKLSESYSDYAKNCERFMLGLADVGLVALIDEATGYDKIKRRNEYRELFRAYIRDEQSDWVKEFPDAFFDGIYKVYRVERSGKNHPSFFGGFINKYVYVPLVNSHGAILKMLQMKDPVVEQGGRRWKLHQFLTDEVGKPALRAHLSQIEVLLRVSADKGRFKRLFKEAFPQPLDQLEFDFGED